MRKLHAHQRFSDETLKEKKAREKCKKSSWCIKRYEILEGVLYLMMVESRAWLC